MRAAIVASEITCLLFMSVIVSSMLSQRDSMSHRAHLFLSTVIVCIFCTAMDAASYLLEGVPGIDPLLVVFNVIGIGGCDLILMLFAYYARALVNEYQPTSIWHSHIIAFVCGLEFLFVIAGAVSGSVFTVKNGIYREGPLFKYVGIPQIVMMLCFLLFIMTRRRNVGIRVRIAVSTYFILPTAAAILEWLTHSGSFVFVTISLVMMIVYVSLQFYELEKGRMREKIIYEVSLTDVLTGINNRRSYEIRLSEVTPGTPVGVIFCDLNGLKRTNDTQGHEAGDVLILRFCDMLKGHFDAKDIFRISGDEFVVLMVNADEAVFAKQADRLKAEVTENQDIAAVGISYDHAGSVHDLVRQAEQQMYHDKSAYYKRKGFDRRR